MAVRRTSDPAGAEKLFRGSTARVVGRVGPPTGRPPCAALCACVRTDVADPPQLRLAPAVLSEDHKFRGDRSAAGYAPRTGFLDTCAIWATTLNARACREIAVARGCSPRKIATISTTSHRSAGIWR